MNRLRRDAILRLCLIFLIYALGNLIVVNWRQQASIELAVAKGQHFYLPISGQPLRVDLAQLSEFETAVSPYKLVNAQPLTLAEARPWVELGCTPTNCAHLTYFDAATNHTLNKIVLLEANIVLAEWGDEAARPAGNSLVAEEAIAIAANDPAVTAVLGNIGAGDPAMIPMSAWLVDDECQTDWCVDLTFHSPNGDGRIFHIFVNMSQKRVARTFYTRARPELDVALPVAQRDAFSNGCYEQSGWSVCWEMTAHDGLLFRDATYSETPVFDTIKIPQIEAWYPSWPGGYRDEIGFSATVPPFGNTVVNEFDDGFEVRQLFTEFTRWPNCICCYRYEQIIRFFADGSFEPRFISYGPGCDDLSIYRPFWRIDLAQNELVQVWQNNEWAELATEQELFPFVDELGPEGFKLATSSGELLYRWTMLPTDPLGLDEARFFILKENELEGEQPLAPGPGDTFQPPRQWLNDELLSGEEVVLWFVPLLKTKKSEPLWCLPDPEPGINQCEAILRVEATETLPQPTAEELTAMEENSPEPSEIGTAVAPETPATPRPVQGDSVEEIILNSGCGSCHAIGSLGEGRKVGPDLSTIGYEAAGRIPGVSAADYLRQSIVEPNFALAPTCPNGPCLPNIMPQDYSQRLTPGQIELIVNYMLTLDGTETTTNFTIIGENNPADFSKSEPLNKTNSNIISGIDTSTVSVQLIMVGVVFLLTLFLLWKRPYEEQDK